MVSIKRLIWDDWNKGHIARHGVTPDEVIDVCEGDYIERDAKKGRLLLIGPTKKKKMLAIVLDFEDHDVYYPVTARSADKRERQEYTVEKGGEQ